MISNEYQVYPVTLTASITANYNAILIMPTKYNTSCIYTSARFISFKYYFAHLAQVPHPPCLLKL